MIPILTFVYMLGASTGQWSLNWWGLLFYAGDVVFSIFTYINIETIMEKCKWIER